VLAKEGEIIRGGGGTSTELTGWDPIGKEGKDWKAVEEKRAKAQRFYRNTIGRTQALTDESTADEVDTAAATLREAMTATLDGFAKKKRSCNRSKRWWTKDLAKLRKELGAERRRPASIGHV